MQLSKLCIYLKLVKNAQTKQEIKQTMFNCLTTVQLFNCFASSFFVLAFLTKNMCPYQDLQKVLRICTVKNWLNENRIQWNLAILTPLYSYNSLFIQHVHTTFDSSFVHCSAIQTHTVIYRAKEDKLQQRSKTFVLVMSTAQRSAA